VIQFPPLLPGRPRISLPALTLSCLALAISVARAQTGAEEVRLKAAVVYRVPEFVEWPASVLEQRTSVEVCVAAPAPLTSALTEMLNGSGINGRPYSLRRINDASDIDSCHVLFASGPAAPTRTLLRRARAKPILTIGDDPSFLDDGGVMQLRVIDRRVRFDIDAGAAMAADLKMSSRLLSLARTVRGIAQ